MHALRRLSDCEHSVIIIRFFPLCSRALAGGTIVPRNDIENIVDEPQKTRSTGGAIVARHDIGNIVDLSAPSENRQ